MAATTASMPPLPVMADWFVGLLAARLARAPQAQVCNSTTSGNCRMALTTCSMPPLAMVKDCSSMRLPATPATTAHAASCTAATRACRRIAAMASSTADCAAPANDAGPQAGTRAPNARQAAACTSASLRCTDIISATKRHARAAAPSVSGEVPGLGARPASTAQASTASSVPSVPRLHWARSYSAQTAGMWRSNIRFGSLSYLSTRATTGSNRTAPWNVPALKVCNGPARPVDLSQVLPTRAWPPPYASR
mmetsp:Transcript_51366/g.142186  ORF Transcript_51366/g.142186 Transcript_51366/m.142186 type:complete len:251 (+) Transcript_51366:711-1463(+)